uniref:Inositol polyphosphate-related phosphatase domain-containing protein n=1 Tax=Rhizophora mucronata TaxID=61149 RepID=A0A2P2LIV2_RHIMU
MKSGYKNHRRQPEFFWPRVILRKWLNISTSDSDYSADTDSGSDYNSDSASDTEECGQWGRKSQFQGQADRVDTNDAFPKIRRCKSETFRAQYINTKEIRICVGTWNVGGKLPPDDLVIDDWIDTDEPADIYVFGLQEIVPLNAGNIFGAEDSRPVPKWENIIRETLNTVRPARTKVNCYSDPPSPSKFKPSDDVSDIEEEILLESDSDVGEEIHPLDEESSGFDEFKSRQMVGDMLVDSGAPENSESRKLGVPGEKDLHGQFSSPKRLERLNCLRTEAFSDDVETQAVPQKGKLIKMLSGTERISLCWPEPQLDSLPQRILQRSNSSKSIKSFKATKSRRAYSSFKSMNDIRSGLALLAVVDLEYLMKRKRRPSYVRIVSKQMVGIFLTIWVRRSLRKHIQNLKLSTVGVGVMGYIGNKGSISVRMSIYQTFFCFICTHLTSGEKDGDELKRNADVHEILRRTRFRSFSGARLPKSIHDHERIIWLGDLNYRINLSYEKTRELISEQNWTELAERDQLVREFRKGCTFDGWSEGRLNFPPTYKYEINSDKYSGKDPKAGRRIPAWCDRILSYGRGMRQLNYRRTELKLSDHRPVTATYMAGVEVFCPRKLQRALTFTDAEIENEEVVAEMGIDVGIGRLKLDPPPA